MKVVSIVPVGMDGRFVNFRGMGPRDQAGESKVTIPEGWATLNIPKRASRIEFIKSWCSSSIKWRCRLQQWNARNAAHI